MGIWLVRRFLIRVTSFKFLSADPFWWWVWATSGVELWHWKNGCGEEGLGFSGFVLFGTFVTEGDGACCEGPWIRPGPSIQTYR